MYGCADPYLIYGWVESDRHRVLSFEWMEEHNIQLFATDMVRNHAGNAVYGVGVNIENNKMVCSEELKKIINNLLKSLEGYYKKRNEYPEAGVAEIVGLDP